MEAGRVDCCPCLLASETQRAAAAAQDGATRRDTPLRRFIRDTYAPRLLTPAAKVLVLVLFGGVALVAGLRLRLLHTRMPWTEFMPRDSYLLDFHRVRDGGLGQACQCQ